MPPTVDNISPGALGWALAHVKRFGDTDVFPTAFEFSAIAASWREVHAYLSSLDLSTHSFRGSMRLLSPKHTNGFRVVAQLEPYDSLLFLGIAREAGDSIERIRVPEGRGIACSYRIAFTPDGHLFKSPGGWEQFQETARARCGDGRTRYVLTADISDFYNQIYHHRIESALELSGVEQARCRNVETLLGGLTAEQTRGVPVGPMPSILLAEACLADVDDFLLRKGFDHVRYVDDFRIFCPSRSIAIEALHALTDYLNSAHKLSLQGTKTRIHTKREFLTRELEDPERLERDRTTKHINEILSAIPSSYVDPDDEEAVKEIENAAARDALHGLFQDVVRAKNLPLGLARYTLRRARSLRSNVILAEVLANLDRLVPVLRDVVGYLRTAYPRKTPRAVGEAILAMLDTSDWKHIPFVQLWLLQLLADAPALVPARRALAASEGAATPVRDRMSALIARSHHVVDWVRERKETWDNTSPWAQRAIIWSGAILPDDERRAWLGPIASRPVSDLCGVVARSAKNGVSQSGLPSV